jgi:hypothetical protein
MPLPAHRQALLTMARLAMVAVVVSMAGWNAYVCLRLRPDVPTTIINLAFWLVPMAALRAATGQVWRSLALGTVLTFGLQRLHWLKWRYLEQSWTAADLRFLVDPANWILLRQYPDMFAWSTAGLATAFLAWLLVPPTARQSARVRGTAACVAVALTGATAAWRHQHEFDPFGFNRYGHFASLVFSWSTLHYEPPVVTGSSDLFRARADAVPPAADVAATRPPTIVVWLQESSMDLRLLDVPGARLPQLAMYGPDAFTRAFGALRVHSWGGSTWLSEFALLTGLSHFDFGPTGEGVYYTVAGHVRPSLPRLLRTHGYRSVAISGVPKGLYNMETAQRQLGFDEVLNPLDFPEWGGKSLADHLISDEELGRYADQIIARTEQPLFLFVLSMMQHGPYDSAFPPRYGLDRATLSRGLAARASDYADRMEATDRATLSFGGRLLGREAPTVFAYFGDHHPNLDGAIPYAAGVPSPQYQTAYAVKSNLPGAHAPATAAQPIDVSFLGALVLEQAGLPLDAHFAANRAMRHLCDGQLTDCPDTALVESYRARIYADLAAAQPR